MNSEVISMRTRSILLSGLLSLVGCQSSSSDFEWFMELPLPSDVKVIEMNGNWGKDPWRCWELFPVNEKLKKDLISTWNLMPDPLAFHGVATGGKVYCQYEQLDESYSALSDSYRAVGIKDNKMIVYFYNG